MNGLNENYNQVSPVITMTHEQADILENKAFNMNINHRRSYMIIKRLFDLFASIFALIVLAPVFLIIVIAIRVDSKGKVIFTQERIGKNGKVFKMYKFRSMCNDAEEKKKDLMEHNEVDGPVFKMAKDPRVTKVGRFIRKTSIDELPQLVNIVKGQMSIVGPRPALPSEVEQYTEYQKRRLAAVQGLTCYWQISGRSDTTFDEWVDLDLKYIREQSLLVDFKIIMKTVKVVFCGKGAY